MLLYGANGYTGELIARLAVTYNLQPILCGRNEAAITSLAKELNLPHRIVSLEDTIALHEILEDVDLVLHAAGPFQVTAAAMMEACLRTKTHYLDITGEIPVFEMAAQLDERARAAGIMIMPGVGFDVVPTDCMALYLKNQLLDAVQLQLAFASVGGSLSQGTGSTMILGLGEGGLIRENGRIVKCPLGHKGMYINFDGEKKFVMTIPWGDVSTAYYTTSIPNIETYTAVPRKIFLFLRIQTVFNRLLKTSFVRSLVRKKLRKLPAGPDERAREKSYSFVWGRVTNPQGKTVESSLKVANGYTLTAHSSLLIAQKVGEGSYKCGFQTPAKVYGADLILELPGSVRNPATAK